MRWVQDSNALYNFIGFVVLRAPDSFPEEDFLQPAEQLNLERAFEEMRHGVDLIKPTMLDEAKRSEALSLLEEALNAYRAGDQFKGAHLLQDFRNLIFKKQTRV